MGSELLSETAELLTWNVNGLRACLKRLQVDIATLLQQLEGDVICLQETKLTPATIDLKLCTPPGWDVFYSCARPKGVWTAYSGVATFCRQGFTPLEAYEGFSPLLPEHERPAMADLDAEGRCLVTDHGAFLLFNVYFPAVRRSGDTVDEERFDFKMRFHEALLRTAESCRAAGREVIIVGDFNVARAEIDHCDPAQWKRDNPGLSFDDAPARRWLSQTLHAGHWVDTFRELNPTTERAFTCWSQLTGARLTNYGTRLDYIVSSKPFFARHFTKCSHKPEQSGSDHCPVSATLQWRPSAQALPKEPPKLCARFLSQQHSRGSIVTLLSRISATADLVETNEPSGKRRCVSQPESQPRKAAPQATLDAFFRKDPRAVTAPVVQAPSFLSSREQQKYKKYAHVAPLCTHNEPCIRFVVQKAGPNFGRAFWVCARPQGIPTDPGARCRFFQWEQ